MTTETFPVSAPPRSARTAPEWATLLVVLAGTFMITLDFFIVNVAIPTMQRELHSTSGEIQWVVAGYGLAIASGVITAGGLGDLYGQRRIYAIGLALFTLASLACGISATSTELVVARVGQGVAAALLMPTVLAIISTAFRGAALVRAFTAYGLTLGLAAVFGQLIGGGLIAADLFGSSWRACFLINLPIGIAALAFTRRVVPQSQPARSSRLDLIGMTIVTAALVALVLPLIQGQSLGWPTWTYACLGASVVLFALFIAYQRMLLRRGAEPLVNLTLFTSRGFSLSIVTQFMFWVGQASFFLVLAIFLQDGHGLSPLKAGVVFVAIGAGYLLTSMNSGRLAARMGRQTIGLGALIMVVGLVALQIAVRSSDSVGWLTPGLFIDGVGMGMALAPLSSTVLSYVPPQHVGAGSGVSVTTMQVAGAVGVAIIGIVFYQALHGGYPHAFAACLTLLTVVELAVAVIVQLLPKTAVES